ncbi:dienelactone hydrolase family protein [Pseudoduganella sp. R-43]|uniref:dienelactone hydrolase family protein n=1 Tax=unclassified Pseudoduganella TaxID=2637179 RepID=UPI003CF9AB45
MDLSTQWVTVQGPDGAFDAFLALPRSGHGPALLLLQEIFGVNAHIRAVAEQYAADGYVVLAPDLFWRQGKRLEFGYDEADWGRAAQCMQRTDVAQAQADIGAAAAALRATPGAAGRLAALGYCWGGRMAYLALANDHAEHAVAYYGGGIQHCLERADDIRAPLLLHFGGRDAHIPLEAVRQVAERFGAREQVEIHLYPDAEHGFNCNHRNSYHQPSAAEAHGHTLLFLSENQ